MTTQSTSLRIADDLSRNPFAWPGGYTRFGITSDCQPMCTECCKSERVLIATTTGTDGWCLVASGIHYEGQLYCSNCSSEIPASYE